MGNFIIAHLTRRQFHAMRYEKICHGSSKRTVVANINDAFGESVVSYSTAFRWFTRFRSGDRSFDEHKHPGRRWTLDDKRLLAALKANPKASVRDLKRTLSQCHCTTAGRLHTPGYQKVRTKCAPNLFMMANKEARLSVCQSLLHSLHRKEFLEVIATGDETWVSYDNNTHHVVWL